MAAAIPLGFLIAAFFSRARLASIVGPFALFAMVGRDVHPALVLRSFLGYTKWWSPILE